MKEQPIRSFPGIPTLLMLLLALIADGAMLVRGVTHGSVTLVIAGLVVGAVLLVCLGGFYMVEPNQAAVVSLFGKYVGTVKDQGLRWNNPFYAAKKVSLRVRNFESGRLKVNELEGSPIEIAAVIVWQVVDSAEAVYNVDDYESFVHIQSESALRAMATEIRAQVALLLEANRAVTETELALIAVEAEKARAWASLNFQYPHEAAK